MRSLFIGVVALALCSATVMPETIYTKRRTNAIREGAGSYYGLVGSVPENVALTVIARSEAWVKVQLPNKQVGWIAANSLRAEMSESLAASSQELLWSSPRALSAAIKGFGKQYVHGEPGIVDSVMLYSEKSFTAEDLAAFSKETRESPSRNRGRVQVEDLDLPAPEYDANISERQLGVGIAARISGKGMVQDRRLHRYVNMLCAAITEPSALYDVDLTVLVLNDGAINAYAVPGGYVLLTLGLVTRCRDESELAGVIAHEIAHVYRRHGLQEVSNRLAGIRADVAFRELEEEVGEPTEDERELESLTDQAYERIVHPRLLSYELEADRIGAVLAANAGYDPFGLVRISKRLADASTEAPDRYDPDYMKPDDAAKRAVEIRAFAEKSFVADSPGERMSSRFMAATSSLR